MNNPPCNDCLVLVMCKERAKKYYNEKKFTHSNQRLIDNTILRLAYSCSILYKYCEISGAYDLNAYFEQILLDHESSLVLKGKKDKMSYVKQFFNFPEEKGDDSVKSNM